MYIMDRQKRNIINNLLKEWPKGTIAVHPWLIKQGVYRQLADVYVKGGWLERIGQGAFKRAGEKVDWIGGVYALQTQLDASVHPAGKAALQLHGNAHYVPADFKQSKIVLFGVLNEKLPAWFNKYLWGVEIRYVMTGLFGNDKPLGLTSYNAGDYDIKISSPERAALEFCYDVPSDESFDELSHIISGLTTLRPPILQDLLERCRSIKAKRLFMYLAEKHQHSWVNRLDLTRVDFGRGKRSICKGGRYDSKYKIVVPK